MVFTDVTAVAQDNENYTINCGSRQGLLWLINLFSWQAEREMITEFLELYLEAGMIGVVGAMFVFMVYQNAKRAEQQAEDLEALKIENEGQSKNIENIEQIVIKFLDRWNRSDETRDRRHEDMVKEVNDLSDVMMEVKGQVSRINGK